MKIAIEKLGKIDKASFDIKDLTIFVGKNSTNKSYVANSVYKLNKTLSFDLKRQISILYNSYLFREFLEDNRNLIKKIEKIEREIIEEERFDKELREYYNVREIVFNLNNKEDLVDEIIKIIEVYLKNYILIQINHCFNSSENFFLKDIKIKHKNLIIKKRYKIKAYEPILKDDNTLFLEKIFEEILHNYKEIKTAKYEYYFPASRTGFVLALDEIVSGLGRNYGIKNNSTTKLTEATSDFISLFMDIKLKKFIENSKDSKELFLSNVKKENCKDIETILAFIEKRLIHGKIVQEKNEDEFSNFYLKTENEKKIELHLSSSSTLELLPLVAFLKRFSTLNDKFLIIEEPEAHLHPQAQIEMARLIVMLVNAGAKVLITTHSDYILSEINNCIKLSNIKESKKYEYLKKYKLDESVVIDKDRVLAYLFKEKKDKIVVDELSIDDYGIANDNFDEVLDELLDRTQEINESF